MGCCAPTLKSDLQQYFKDIVITLAIQKYSEKELISLLNEVEEIKILDKRRSLLEYELSKESNSESINDIKGFPNRENFCLLYFKKVFDNEIGYLVLICLIIVLSNKSNNNEDSNKIKGKLKIFIEDYFSSLVNQNESISDFINKLFGVVFYYIIRLPGEIIYKLQPEEGLKNKIKLTIERNYQQSSIDAYVRNQLNKGGNSQIQNFLNFIVETPFDLIFIDYDDFHNN